MRELTDDELEVITLLVRSWNILLRLPQVHPHEQAEFMRAIHEAQRIVMSRPAIECLRQDKEKL